MALLMGDGSVMWIPPANYLVRCQHESDAVIRCSLKSVIRTTQFDNQGPDLQNISLHYIQSENVESFYIYGCNCTIVIILLRNVSLQSGPKK